LTIATICEFLGVGRSANRDQQGDKLSIELTEILFVLCFSPFVFCLLLWHDEMEITIRMNR
jgi:hypothetical protein